VQTINYIPQISSNLTQYIHEKAGPIHFTM